MRSRWTAAEASQLSMADPGRSLNAIFIAESKAGFLITPGKGGGGDQIWRRARASGVSWKLLALGSRHFFLFFSLGLGTLIVLRRICSLVYWEPCIPAGTTGTIWNPYKSEGSYVCFACEVEKGGEEGGKKSLVHCDFLQPGQLFLKGQLSSSALYPSEQQTAAECAASSRHIRKSRS